MNSKVLTHHIFYTPILNYEFYEFSILLYNLFVGFFISIKLIILIFNHLQKSKNVLI